VADHREREDGRSAGSTGQNGRARSGSWTCRCCPRPGAAGSALTSCRTFSRSRGARKAVSIHVEKNNPAWRLYARLGFKVVEHKGVYDLMEWRPAPGDQKKIAS
jgi:hypothetical protein